MSTYFPIDTAGFKEMSDRIDEPISNYIFAEILQVKEKLKEEFRARHFLESTLDALGISGKDEKVNRARMRQQEARSNQTRATNRERARRRARLSARGTALGGRIQTGKSMGDISPPQGWPTGVSQNLKQRRFMGFTEPPGPLDGNDISRVQPHASARFRATNRFTVQQSSLSIAW